MNENMNQFTPPKDVSKMVDAVHPKEKLNQDNILDQKYHEILDNFKDVGDIDDSIEALDADLKSNARNRLYWLVNETETVCRHAFSMDADYILVLDKAGRNYGYLFNLVLPALRVEYCKLNNKKIEDIKLPEIKFFNPPKNWINWDNQEKELKDAFGKLFDNKKILVFDEGSGEGNSPYRDNMIFNHLKDQNFPDPQRQYDFYKTEHNQEQYDNAIKLNGEYHWEEGVFVPNIREDVYWAERQHSHKGTMSADNVTRHIAHLFPSNTVHSHTGASNDKGGNLSFFLFSLGKDWDDIYYLSDKDKSAFARKNEDVKQQQINEVHGISREIAKKIVGDVYEKSFEEKDRL